MRVLVYYLHNPWPPRSGSHRRCLATLEALAARGAEVFLASSTRYSETPWTAEAVAGLQELGVKGVFVFRSGRAHGLFERLQRRYRALRRRPRQFGDGMFCSSWMRSWFDRLARRLDPDVILMNYALADQMLDHGRHRHRRRGIEMHDLFSVNRAMGQVLRRQLDEFRRTGVARDLFDEDLAWASGLEPDPRELEIYDRYDVVIAISQREAALLRSRLRRAKVVWRPAAPEPAAADNTYEGPAVLVASGNPFNQQGLVFFLHRVLPRVLERCPDFRMDVAGNLTWTPVPSGAIRFLGYVSDLRPVLRTARLFVNPVFAGTGQQVKTIEAMANGLPVVAFERAAAEAPLDHGRTGLVARTADEFAEHVESLWRSRELCRKLGESARRAAKGWTDLAGDLVDALSIEQEKGR